MTKKTLQTWYGNGDISYSEKESLNKIGVNDYSYHYLQDLKQILNCENWAKENSETRNKLTSRIKKIVFFTPNFNDGKPDASNYSCAIVTDGRDNNWAVVYRPSYVNEIKSDLIIKEIYSSSLSSVENKLNSEYPITAIEVGGETISLKKYLHKKELSSDARHNPDKYILPLDIVASSISNSVLHYAIYLGNENVVHLLGYGHSVCFDTWNNFCRDGDNSSSFSSGSSRGGRKEISLIHPKIPFKRKEDIIKHIAKTISHGYGLCFCHNYSAGVNNCEHYVNKCVLGINSSIQSFWANHNAVAMVAGAVDPFNPLFGTFTNLKRTFIDNNPLLEMGLMPLETRMNIVRGELNELTSSYYHEEERIERYISETNNNRSYTRSKYQIEQEKFQERIEVYPKDWCRIS